MNRDLPNVTAADELAIDRPRPSARGLWGLARTRTLVRGRVGRVVVAGIAVIYLGLAMFIGGMIELVPTGERGLTFELLVHPAASAAGGNYPALLVLAPGGLVVLPLATTLAMAAVAFGVGLGMGAGLVLALRIVRSPRASRTGRPNARVPFATLTPAMVAVLALGACCSTGAAAAGTLGLLTGPSSGTYARLLGMPWVLNALEVAMLYLALLAQEQLLTIYFRVEAGNTDHRSANTRDPGSVLSVDLAPSLSQ